MSDFRSKCIGRRQLVGTFAAIPHPVAVEVMALAGLDFLCIDWEHAKIARDMIENMVRAADVHSVPAMVRVPGHAPEAVAAALDSGAQGVLVPRVSTAAQAQAAVKASRYPPPASAASGRDAPPAMATASPNTLPPPMRRIVVAVQVETAEGLANTDAIAAVDGVDVVFVGPGDLSVSIDAMGPRAPEARQGDRHDHRRRARARKDCRHILRQPGGVGSGRPSAPASSSWPATRCSRRRRRGQLRRPRR